MNTMRGFDAAQREYDNRTPDEGGCWECSECRGYGVIYNDVDIEETCAECEGHGCLDERACPSPDREADHYEAAERRAEYLRDEPTDWSLE